MSTVTESPSVRPDAPRPSDSTCLSFAHDAGCIARLRSATGSFLHRTRPHDPALLADALLVVTELTTNVVQHTDGPGRLTLTALRNGIAIDVSDTSRTLPAARLALEDVHGRGLTVVAALTDSLTLTLDPGSGKTIHAHLPNRSTTPFPPASHAAPRAHRTW
ncbi:ATP-binding protein [Kitasatospora sp. NPDC086009]|uniref:ATP-binding protein n=1 Tax=unclassified Kitasatospora TaxID=2633591 RepID=UPI0037C59971